MRTQVSTTKKKKKKTNNKNQVKTYAKRIHDYEMTINDNKKDPC
jgi:hypothetical protein